MSYEEIKFLWESDCIPRELVFTMLFGVSFVYIILDMLFRFVLQIISWVFERKDNRSN